MQSIAVQWAVVETLFVAGADAALVEIIDDFRLSLGRVQGSTTSRAYRAVPFLRRGERSLAPHRFTDIREAELALDFAADFRAAVVSGETQRARAAAAEISASLMRLLAISADKQRNIATAYFSLFATLVAIIVVIVLPFLILLRRSLNRALKGEAEGKVFSHTYMLAQDAERARISRELHDTVIQDMRYLLLETEKIGNTVDKDEREALSGRTVPMMADLMRRTRDICNDLIPPDFRNSELPHALGELCLDFGGKTGIACWAEIDPGLNLEFLNLEKRLQVFRIVQEALVNIEKHAEAREAIVTMRSGSDGTVYIGIGDDGKGFVPPLDGRGRIKTAIDKSRLGIVSMYERAEILGARLKIDSDPGNGTLIRMKIPLPVVVSPLQAKETDVWKYF